MPRPREVLGALRSVLFAPEDLALVRGDPGERRRFLDELLVQRAPRYAGVRSDYDRVLKQRGALLKSARAHRGSGAGADLRTLDVWDGHLARFGAELVAGRLALVRDLAPLRGHRVRRGGPGRRPGRGVVLQLRSARRCHRASRGRSCWRRPCWPSWPGCGRPSSSAGSRSSVRIATTSCSSLGGRVAKGYASHGESWSYALALRLASYELLSGDGAEPVLVLDDVFAELDTARRGRLAKLAGARRAGAGHARRSPTTCRQSCSAPATTSPTGRSAVSGEAGV